MKIFFSEAPADYSTYTFPYGIYAVYEKPDDLNEIYARGFLPYSDIRFIKAEKPLFYLARSVRVDLSNFALTSENRRIRKKTASLGLHYEILPKNALPLSEMYPLILPYIHERIGEAIDDKRLHYIYHFPLLNKIAVFRNDTEILGYVWLIENKNLRHYWFAFFKTAYLPAGLGKRMMEQMISDAKERGMKHVYLGTCYGDKALYKVRDFKGVEFFDGNRWNTDLIWLKQKCKNDRIARPDDLKIYPDNFKGFIVNKE